MPEELSIISAAIFFVVIKLINCLSVRCTYVCLQVFITEMPDSDMNYKLICFFVKTEK